MVKLVDIAKASGYDVATVSRAISGNGSVKPETKQEILAIAKDMHYVPNIMAKKLKMQKSWNVAVILDIKSNKGLKHYFFTDILNSFLKAIEHSGYDVTFITKEIKGEFDILSHCRSRMFDGVFVLGGDMTDKKLVELVESDIPVAMAESRGDFPKDYNLSFVTTNNREAMFSVTDYVLQKGHKDVVFVTGEDIFVTHERIKGFQSALKSHGIPFDKNMLIASEYTNLNKMSEAMQTILTRKTLPTAIFIPDDYSAIAAYGQMKEHGLTVGEDISVIGFDGIEMAQSLYPPLTTVKQDAESIGKNSAEKLLMRIEQECNGEFDSTICSSSILVGSSVKDLSQ